MPVVTKKIARQDDVVTGACVQGLHLHSLTLDHRRAVRLVLNTNQLIYKRVLVPTI